MRTSFCPASLLRPRTGWRPNASCRLASWTSLQQPHLPRRWRTMKWLRLPVGAHLRPPHRLDSTLLASCSPHPARSWAPPLRPARGGSRSPGCTMWWRGRSGPPRLCSPRKGGAARRAGTAARPGRFRSHCGGAASGFWAAPAAGSSRPLSLSRVARGRNCSAKRGRRNTGRRGERRGGPSKPPRPRCEGVRGAHVTHTRARKDRATDQHRSRPEGSQWFGGT
mmetsp:Transcript_8568/g.20832  ORF Transcript_8568/g.20832 Transcript_8568/m.20832 type:complete len:223 (-) Transcript_8568:4878-5546(-)